MNRIIEAFKIWGNLNREGILKLSRAMRLYLIGPLMDALATEKDALLRRLYVSILSGMGSDVGDEAVKRLDNVSVDVIRDTIFLIRKCGRKQYIREIRQFVSHDNIEVKTEALKTLLEFRTFDSVTRLKEFIKDKNPELRDRAIMLSGRYRFKVFQSKSFLFRSSLEEIKVEVFRTLNKYPPDSVPAFCIT